MFAYMRTGVSPLRLWRGRSVNNRPEPRTGRLANFAALIAQSNRPHRAGGVIRIAPIRRLWKWCHSSSLSWRSQCAALAIEFVKNVVVICVVQLLSKRVTTKIVHPQR